MALKANLKLAFKNTDNNAAEYAPEKGIGMAVNQNSTSHFFKFAFLLKFKWFLYLKNFASSHILNFLYNLLNLLFLFNIFKNNFKPNNTTNVAKQTPKNANKHDCHNVKTLSLKTVMLSPNGIAVLNSNKGNIATTKTQNQVSKGNILKTSCKNTFHLHFLYYTNLNYLICFYKK